MSRSVRVALCVVVPTELTLLGCLLAGVDIPYGLLVAAELLLGGVLVGELALFARLFLLARRAGDARLAAFRAGLRGSVPRPLWFLARHEMRAVASLPLWALRRRSGVGEGDHAVAYAGAQASTMFLLAFAMLVETVVLAALIPWPVVHLVVLVLDLYGLSFVLATHAACVVRPHVIGADGTLRVRYGVFFDLSVPAERIATARIERSCTEGAPVHIEDGVLTLSAGSQTSLSVVLTEPVWAVRPLGRREKIRVVRFHADDPPAALATLTRVSDGRSAERRGSGGEGHSGINPPRSQLA